MVLIKKWPFFHVFFLRNIGQENVFYNILERKNAFLAHKRKKFKKSKNWDFSKGVNPCFWSKNGHFSMSFFFCNIGQENVIYNIPEQENACVPYKKNTFKKSKNWDFSKGVNPSFRSKNGHLFMSFFRQYSLEKGVLQYSRTKNCLSSPQKSKVQKVEKLRFLQRG